MYSIDPPQLQYNITLRLLEFQGIVRNITARSIHANWKQVSTIYLGPIQPIARSKNGRVSEWVDSSKSAQYMLAINTLYTGTYFRSLVHKTLIRHNVQYIHVHYINAC